VRKSGIVSVQLFSKYDIPYKFSRKYLEAMEHELMQKDHNIVLCGTIAREKEVVSRFRIHTFRSLNGVGFSSQICLAKLLGINL
jgi:hypothetical protein